VVVARILIGEIELINKLLGMEKIPGKNDKVINFPERRVPKEVKNKFISIKLIYPPGVPVISIHAIMQDFERRIKKAIVFTASDPGYSDDPKTESQLFGIKLREQDFQEKSVQNYLNELREQNITLEIREVEK